MTCIATEAGWSIEKAGKVAKFQSNLSLKYLCEKITLKDAIDELNANTEFTEKDKLYIALVFGVFLSKNLGVFG